MILPLSREFAQLAPPKSLSAMDAAYLDDLCRGLEYSPKYPPYSVKRILERLLIARVAEVYTTEGHEMIRVTSYGKQMRGIK